MSILQHLKLRRRWLRVQRTLFPQPLAGDRVRVGVVVPDFPTMGGVSTVLKGMAQVMDGRWVLEYLTQYVGPNAENYVVHRFGSRETTPWHFPFVWLYVGSGIWKCLMLLHRNAEYQLLLPQDGVFSALLAGVVGKLTGRRVVCIDHGNLSFFTARNMAVYQAERLQEVKRKYRSAFVRQVVRMLLRGYWPSLLLMARLAARLVDHYLIPGVAGDSIGEGCSIVGIPPEKITRYTSMIDLNRHPLLSEHERAALRQRKGLPAEASVIAIVCRLAPEKGLDTALVSIQQALQALDATQRKLVRVVIAGDGPLREQIERDIRQPGMANCCELWGELTSDEVIELLSVSDIFLYTSLRGACFAMAVLEAMASACAVIASTEPLSNAVLLADGRGIAVAAGDQKQISQGLLRLLTDRALCRQMGQRARSYIATYHSPALFREALLQVETGVAQLAQIRPTNELMRSGKA